MSGLPHQIRQALTANHFVWIRNGKHEIYRHKPSGRILCLSMGRRANDWRQARILATIRAITGGKEVYGEEAK